jgi:CRISPR system Cascade subunit CasA
MTAWACVRSHDPPDEASHEGGSMNPKTEPACQHNLLDEALFGIETPSGKQAHLSLPGLLEALGSGQIESFSALRPHQQHAWHAFLVQLGAIALHKANESEVSQTAGRWREFLLALTDDAVEPWCLFVEDLAKPAFMQPAVPEGSIGPKWKTFHSPAVIDVLQTAKNHDLKTCLICDWKLEHWAYALVSLQTMEGVMGRGKYGIARMNSGLGSRPVVTLAPGTSLSERFIHDARILLEQRTQLLTDEWPYLEEDGLTLLWLQPWDGKQQLALSQLDPYFIEICRRIRLTTQPTGLIARGFGTESTRIAADNLRGVTGDPWTPVTADEKGVKALTISSTGFSYKLTCNLLFSGDFKHGLCWQHRDKGDMLFLAQSLARAQGKTEGLHQRQIPVPAKVTSLFSKPEGENPLAKRSATYIQYADEVRRRVLHLALCVITQGAKSEPDFRDTKDQPWLNAFERDVDAIFFDRLFAQIEFNDEEAHATWARELLELAEKQLDDALRSIPQASMRRYRIDSAARGCFFGSARKKFPELYPSQFEDKKGGEA